MKSIVVTTINGPTKGIAKLASLHPEWHLLVVGDRKTPNNWSYPDVRFVSVEEQLSRIPGKYATQCPMNHYGRKNIGYLECVRLGAEVIAETDDDNIPYDFFLKGISVQIGARRIAKQGWDNVYRHFTEEEIWPRGFPLELITESYKGNSALESTALHECAIQQFLADCDPDVDAIFRLCNVKETKFHPNRVVLGKGTYCPFNSQNTIWWPEAYMLMYLPSYVSFRMTDIWRSFVAQVCLYRWGGKLAFCEASVYQLRNEHNLLRDFKDEIPGYLNNARIIEVLESLDLPSDAGRADVALRMCYEALVSEGIVPEAELPLLEAWIEDLKALQQD